jgi:chromosome segregation ATPase
MKALTFEQAKDQVAKEAYPSWHELYNWVARPGENPAIVAQQIESWCNKAAELHAQSIREELQIKSNQVEELSEQVELQHQLARADKNEVENLTKQVEEWEQDSLRQGDEIEKQRKEIDGLNTQLEVTHNNWKGTVQKTIEKYNKEIEALKQLTKNIWGLWESMAECGELTIGKQFSESYKKHKEEIEKLIK